MAPQATPTGPRAAPVNHDFRAPKMTRMMLVPSYRTSRKSNTSSDTWSYDDDGTERLCALTIDHFKAS